MSSRGDRARLGTATARAFYRLLLLAYPRRFRERHARSAATLFGDACAESWKTSGTTGVVRRLGHAMIEVPRVGLRERRSARADRARAARSGTPVPARLYRPHLLADVRVALRRWRRRPGFALTAGLTLAVGLGATTTIFSVVDAVLLEPLPWRDADRLYAVHGVFPEQRADPARAETWNRGEVSMLTWDALRSSDLFETVGIIGINAPMTADAAVGDGVDLVHVQRMSANFLPMLGVELAAGRYFGEAEDTGPLDHVIINHHVWIERFGGQADVVGQTVDLGPASGGTRRPYTVVGVLASSFALRGDHPDFILSIGISAESNRIYPYRLYRVVARLAPGVDPDAATSAAGAIVSRVETEEPTTARLASLYDEQIGAAGPPLWLLLAGAGILLIVACANVAGLISSDSGARRHELAVRAALGGGPWRLTRQLLVEYVMLAGIGTAGGLLLAWTAVGTLVAYAPSSLPRLESTALDWRVAAFGVVMGAATLLVFGLMPAISLARARADRVLLDGSHTATLRRYLGHRALVAVQIALALVLLVCGGLLGETLYRLTSQPLGFDPTNLAVISTRDTRSRTAAVATMGREALLEIRRRPDFGAVLSQLTSQVRAEETRLVLERLRAIPGVVGAAATGGQPFVRETSPINLRSATRPDVEPIAARRRTVTEGWFDLVGLRAIEGRTFDGTDQQPARAAVVSRELARRMLESSAPGQRVESHWGDGQSTAYDVVGVVPDIRESLYDLEVEPTIYLLDRQGGSFIFTDFVVRTSGDTVAALGPAQQVVASIDPGVVVTGTTTMEITLADVLAAERLRASLSVLFGGAALILSAIGLYGLATRRVADRRREIGVRVALGAKPSSVRRLVLTDAWANALVGLIVGLPAAWATSQITGAYLFGVSPTAPHVFVAAAVVLAGSAILATLLPARRASCIDPVQVLKD